MSKKLILLMLCIPIIIMVGLFTTTKTVSMAIDVAVNGIEISSDKFVYLDLDDREHKEQISYTIYPTNAKNKNVSFDVTQYSENSPKAELEITEDGYINPKTPGKSRVTITTADGGYNASLVVEVVASGLIDIKATSETDTLYVGEETKINVVFEPDTVNDKVLTYSSSNPNVCMVVGNRLRAIAKGEAIITVASESHPEINDEFKITVLNKDILNIYFNYYLENNIHIKKCENCGKYFIPTSRSDEKYCDNVSPQNPQKTCKEYGAKKTYRDKINSDKIQKAHFTTSQFFRMKIKRCKNEKEKEKLTKLFEKYKTNYGKQKNKFDNKKITENYFVEWIVKQKDIT